MNLKKILFFSAITGAAAFYYLGNRVKEIVTQFQKIYVVPFNIRNVSSKWNDGQPTANFTLDLKFINPTPIDFNAGFLAVTLKRILLYDKRGTLFAVSEVKIGALYIQKLSTTTVPNINVIIDLQKTLLQLSTVPKDFFSDGIEVKAVLSILGTEYTV